MKYSWTHDVLTVLCVTLLISPLALAQVRSSTGFQMERDSINFAGGLSTSSQFELEATAGQVTSGFSTSSNFLLNAGFQQQPEVTLTLSGGTAVVMSGDLGGITGGESTGNTAVHASTDGAAGYQLTIQASNDPAMQDGSNTIADYTPAGATPDIAFTTGANDAHFAFSPTGPDTSNRYLTNGGSCGSGAASSTACWDGLRTTAVQIASAPGANTPGGATTTIHFRVGIGGSVTQPPGTYVATTTVTLLSL